MNVKAPPPGDRPLKTLDRVLSKAGVGSRREAREIVAEGRVDVNGVIAASADQWVDLERDRIRLDGRPLETAERIYLMLNKPAGYLTTYRHPTGRATVYELLPGHIGWVFPVGRLDLDTTGLLLMTNDSHFAQRIMSPDYHVPKTYRVTAEGKLDEAQFTTLREGVELNDGRTRPAMLSATAIAADRTTFELTITEGRNRQVRRMLEAVGSRVLELERIAVGPLHLGNLPQGQTRPLASEEVEGLLATAADDRGGQ